MAEAEGILIEAIERATAPARAMWASRRAALAPETVALAELRPWLQVLLRACYGADHPLVASDPAPPRGRLARTLGRVAPWERQPAAVAFTDGARIFLPRELPRSSAEGEPRERFVMAALGLAGRLHREAVRCCPDAPLARDLFWAAQGLIGDRSLADELPGLAPELARARRSALALRPELRDLRDVEQRFEALVRAWLRDDALDSSREPAADLCDLSPRAVARWAERWSAEQPDAADYRGTSPVEHWGVPRPDLVARAESKAARKGGESARDRGKTPRSRRLERRIETRLDDPDDDDAKAPILLASEEGHLSVQDPAGLRRPRDQESDDRLDLDALADELARVPELARIREPGSAGEVLEPDDEGPLAAGADREPAAVTDGGGICYPEWDYRLVDYRRNHCVVRETPAPEGDPYWADTIRSQESVLMERVRRLFAALRPRRVLHRRRLDGNEVDLDAFVADYADRRAGLPASDRIYLEQRPDRRDVAVSFLVDASGSTDAWVTGRRNVLDVAKSATLILCEALQALGDRHAIHAFSGEGPRDVRVLRLRGFAEPSEVAARRIAGLAPDRFTRLGAPLRHLTAGLVRERALRRLLLVLSDGKPNDEDEYEGRYGIEDTRQAVAEARSLGIEVFCLTIDREGSVYLPQMFGPFGYAILSDVRLLPERLVDLYRRLTAAGR